jgi:hypothetical protein
VLCAGTRPAGKRAIVRQRRSAENLAAAAVPVACPIKQSIESPGSHSRVPLHAR